MSIAESAWTNTMFMGSRSKSAPNAIPSGSIEESWNKVRFDTQEGAVVSREKAASFALHWIGFLEEEFPQWVDHRVFLTASDGDQEYTLTVGNDRKPIFFEVSE